MKMNNISIEFKLLNSLSHTGETQGPDCYLNTQTILVNNKCEEVFVYSGNAIRGKLRDAGACYLLSDNKKINNSLFYLLFSGGSISGEQKTDISKFKEIRDKFPLISVLGGGIGNAMLSGKLNVSDAYPICKETKELIPEKYEKDCIFSWKQLTDERYFVRTDDSKDVRKQEHMSEERKEKKKGEASTQMRYMVEVLNPSSKLYSFIQCEDCNDIELGCIASCLYEILKSPYLGGKKNIGMGRFQAVCELDKEPFMSVDKEGIIVLQDNAVQLLKQYDEHVKSVRLDEVIL